MLRRMLDGLYLFAGYAAGGFMVLIFALMMGLSAGRPIGFDIPAGDDIVAWCMIFLGMLSIKAF